MKATVIELNVKQGKLARWTDRVTSPFRTMSEFTQLATRSGRGWWLIPMMATLIVLGVVIASVQIIEYVAPFVYTIF